MPRKYIRKPSGAKRAVWTEDALQEASRKIKEGMAVVKAVHVYGIPRRTLERRLLKQDFKKRSLGKSPALGYESEEKLVNHIKRLQAAGFPPTRTDVRQMAYTLAMKIGIENVLKSGEAELAGYHWLHSFLERHEDLCLRKAEGLSLARAGGLNRKDFDDYFELLLKTLEKYDLLESPGKIYNVDETGIQLNNEPGMVIAERGSKSVVSVTSCERGESVTIIACGNAEGTFLPPVLIFKGKHKKIQWSEGLPPGSQIYMNQKSAYISSDLFLQWLREHFIPRKSSGRVLLLLDGHSSHTCDPDLLEMAESHEVSLLCFPSHTTSILQPLDRGFCKAFKSYYKSGCNTFMRINKNRRITRFDVGKLIGDAWKISATVQTGTSMFHATGVYPFNPHQIPPYAFLQIDEAVLPPHPDNQNHNIDQSTADDLDLENIGATEEVSSKHISKSKQVSPAKILQSCSPIPNSQLKSSTRKQRAQLLTSPDSIGLAKQKQCRKKSKNKQLPDASNIKKNVCSRKHAKKCENNAKHGKVAMQCGDMHNSCIQCGENYYQTKQTCDWIKCKSCNKWLHANCSRFVEFCNKCGAEDLFQLLNNRALTKS